MSRVISIRNVCNGNKLIASQVHECCLIQTGKKHCVTTKAQKYMAIVKKQRKVKFRQQMNTDSKLMHMNNINILFHLLLL